MNVLADSRLLALNPDEKTLAAGDKLGAARHWRSGGSNARALWGECLGSAVYQVAIDLVDSSHRCSCPSRKFPCKHVVGLMALHLREPDILTTVDPPDWVESWLARRAARTETAAAARPSQSPANRQKRADGRMERVLSGVAGLELWLSDIERDGLARIQTQPAAFWERQAARLVDAQAPGLAARVKALSAIPTTRSDWAERVLAGLGRLALLVHAFRRLDSLDPLLRQDVLRLVGWSLSSEEVTRLGESVRDRWIVAGQVEEKEDRLTVQRTWLTGRETRRPAVVLQFAPGSGGSLPFVGTPGAIQDMQLRFWPSAVPQRARVEQRFGVAAPCLAIPGSDSIEHFLSSVAESLGRLPWLERSLCVVQGAVLAREHENTWFLRDRKGKGLPLTPGEHWLLLAATGGHPVAVAGEWDGGFLRPMRWFADGEATG